MVLNAIKLVLVMKPTEANQTFVHHRYGVACIISYGTFGRLISILKSFFDLYLDVSPTLSCLSSGF